MKMCGADRNCHLKVAKLETFRPATAWQGGKRVEFAGILWGWILGGHFGVGHVAGSFSVRTS